MLNLLMLAVPGALKGMLPSITKYAKWILLALAVMFTVYTVATAVKRVTNTVSASLKEASDNKALVAVQKQKLDEQKQALDQMAESLEQLQQSHEQTLAVISDLRKEQKKIQAAVVKKKVVIDKKLTDIDTQSELTPEQKYDEKSEVLIVGLNDTFCELFPQSCNTEVNAK